MLPWIFVTVSGVHVFQGWLAESMRVSPQVSLTEHLSTLFSAKQITVRTGLCGRSLREGPSLWEVCVSLCVQGLCSPARVVTRGYGDPVIQQDPLSTCKFM